MPPAALVSRDRTPGDGRSSRLVRRGCRSALSSLGGPCIRVAIQERWATGLCLPRIVRIAGPAANAGSGRRRGAPTARPVPPDAPLLVRAPERRREAEVV